MMTMLTVKNVTTQEGFPSQVSLTCYQPQSWLLSSLAKNGNSTTVLFSLYTSNRIAGRTITMAAVLVMHCHMLAGECYEDRA